MAIKLESKMLSGRLPLLGKLPSGRQLQILTGALVFFLLVDAAVVWLDARQSTFGTMYIATVGKIRMLSQRLAKAAQQASQGNLEAFKQLRESRDEFAAQMKLLLSGGEVGGVSLPATSGDARPVLDALDREWQKNERNAALVIAEERNLIGLGQAVRLMNDRNPALQELADEVSALSVQTGGSARQNAIAAQLMMLTQRMAKNANTMLAEAVIDPQVSFLLGKDVNNFRDTLQALLQGSEALRIQRVGDAELRGKLGELEGAFKEYQRAVADILGSQQRLVAAKRATFDLFRDSESLLRAAEQLNTAYESQLEGRRLNAIVLASVSLLALLCLLLIGKVYLDDSRGRAEESEQVEQGQPGGDSAPARRDHQPGERRPHGARAGDRAHDRRHRRLDQLHHRRAAPPGDGHHRRFAAGDGGHRAGAKRFRTACWKRRRSRRPRSRAPASR